jgi:ATP-dependent Clp protease, protease subunit
MNQNIFYDFRKFALDKSVSRSYLDCMERNVYPTIVEERSSATRAIEMNVFSRLMYDRIIYFSGEVTDDACDTVVAQLLYLANADETRDITLYINSPGGDITAGLGVVDTMDFIKPDVATICVGMAASMGAVLLSNGTKGKRGILPHSRVMIHSASSYMGGHTADVDIRVEQLHRAQNDVYETLAKNCGKTMDEIKALCDRDNWFIGKEAIDLGIADILFEKKS